MQSERQFDGTIQWLKSASSGRLFPNLVFRADVDFATSGLVALTSTAGTEIVITLFIPEECYLYDRPEFAKRCENRINRELDRHDLRIVPLLRTESDPIDASGMTFQEYMAATKPPRLYYRDIHSEFGEATVVREESINKFLESGGTITNQTKTT